jgi:hypothetical protein
MRSVSRAARDPLEVAEVLGLIGALERLNPTPEPTSAAARPLLDGPWSLIATYPTDRAADSRGANGGAAGESDGLLVGPLAAARALSDGVYEALYKNAQWSWLAGSARSSGGSSGASSRSPTPALGARSFQNIDVARGKLYNVVEFGSAAGSSDGGGPSGRITVTGSARPVSGATLEVVFEESALELNPPRGWPLLGRGPPVRVTVPLPRPKGFVEVTYLDETMRVSRGSRRNLFLTVRPKS